MQSVVIQFPGSNRDGDVARALEQASGHRPAFVWHTETELPRGTDLVVLPGGFSYGDYLRCGAIAARAPIMDAVRHHAEAGGLVLGICNGFQILAESGLLPGVLMRNAGLRFISKLQYISADRTDTAFASQYQRGVAIQVVIAHGEGNYTADAETLARLEGEGRVAFRYCDANAQRGGAANPNGSMHDIAGIYSQGLNVLGLMPHAENLVDHVVGGVDGRGLFESLVAA